MMLTEVLYTHDAFSGVVCHLTQMRTPRPFFHQTPCLWRKQMLQLR